MHDVITVGEPMALLIAQQPGPLEEATHFARASAGAELNVAIGLSRLGLRVGYLTRLGDDAFGRYLLSVLAGEGIDHRHVRVDASHPTGFMLKSRRDDGGDPVVEYFRRGSAASRMGPGDCPRGFLAVARHLHLTGISPALSDSMRELVFDMARQARVAGCTISFDPNLRPRLWPSEQAMVDTLEQLASLADWVLPGLAEGRRLTGHADAQAIAAHYLKLGAKKVVVKLGAEGAWFASGDERGHVPGVPTPRVVDTVGAGDGFAVGVISGLLEGLPLAQAAARGNAIGSRVVQFPGDSDGLPRRADLPDLPSLAAR